MAQRLLRSPLEGIELLGFFDDRLAERGAGLAAQSLKGGLRELSEYVKRHRVQLIYLSLPMSSSPRILQVLDELKDTTASIYFVPDMFITDLIQGRSDKVGGVTVISVCDTPFRGWAGVRKRGSDLLLAALILLLLAPLMLRRVKQDVERTLLPKIEINLYLPLSSMQQDLYASLLKKDLGLISGTEGDKSRLLNMVPILKRTLYIALV